MPISSRKLSASILTVGCRCTNALIGSAATIMISTEMMTATTITDTSSTMPTAVITESSEKTMSSSAIWTRTDANEDAGLRRASGLPPLRGGRGSRACS